MDFLARRRPPSPTRVSNVPLYKQAGNVSVVLGLPSFLPITFEKYQVMFESYEVVFEMYLRIPTRKRNFGDGWPLPLTRVRSVPLNERPESVSVGPGLLSFPPILFRMYQVVFEIFEVVFETCLRIPRRKRNFRRVGNVGNVPLYGWARNVSFGQSRSKCTGSCLKCTK